MPPVDPPDVPTWKAIAIGALTLINALGLLVLRSVRDSLKSQGEKISLLEQTRVAREDLEREIALIRADNLRMHQETRAESQRMHASNETYLQRIEDKLERGGHTRHDIRDAVNAMQLMLRSTLEQLKTRDRDRDQHG